MLYEALKLLEPQMLAVLDTTPSDVMLHMDLKGDWQIDDFTLLWTNKRAREHSGHVISTGRLVPSTEANHYAFQSTVDMIREKPQTGFVGPMNIVTTMPSGTPLYLEVSLMYAGAVATNNHVFLMIQHEKQVVMNLPRERAGDESNPVFQMLTPMERKVAIAICRGATTQVMADEFFVSLRTIENHRANIRKKLGITDRQQSIAEALNRECATR